MNRKIPHLIFFLMLHNGLGIATVGDLEAQTLNTAQK